MRLVPLTDKNIDEVVNNLNEASLFEMKEFGLNVAAMKSTFMLHIGEPFTGAFIDDSGNTFALAMIIPTGIEHTWRSYFVVSKEITPYSWRCFTRLWKRFSSQLVADGLNIVFETALAHGEGEIHRWYKMLGFEWEGKYGKISKYRKYGGRPCALVGAIQLR